MTSTHGINATYTTGCRCAECTAAHTAYMADYRSRKKSELTAELASAPCTGDGTTTCRCPQCRARITLLQADHYRIQRDAKQLVEDEQWELPVKIKDTKLEVYEPMWVINSFVELGSVGMLVGPPSSAKSFLALDWTLCITHGQPWQGYEVPEAMNVIYIASEGSAGIAKRVKVWHQENGLLPNNRADFYQGAVHLKQPSLIDQLCREIKQSAVGLVVIDTLARSIPGMSENDSGEMGLIIENLYRLRDAYEPNGTSVICLHHTGKDQSLGARGTSRFLADVDFAYQVSRASDAEPFIMACRKQKDDEVPPPFAYTLRRVDLRGKPGISSCVIEPEDMPSRNLGVASLSKTKRAILDTLVNGGMTARALVTATGFSRGGIYTAVTELDQDGLVQGDGQQPETYAITPEGHNRVNPPF